MSYVYFVQAGEGGPLKIGHTINPGTRLSALQTACSEPVNVLGLIEGDLRRERRIHRALAAHRRTGEWFDPSPAVLGFARRLIEREGVQPSDAGAAIDERELTYVRAAADAVECMIGELYRSKELTSAQALEEISQRSGVSLASVWGLKYRPPTYMTVGVYEALTTLWVDILDEGFEAFQDRDATLRGLLKERNMPIGPSVRERIAAAGATGKED